jgi:YfiH family protein
MTGRGFSEGRPEAADSGMDLVKEDGLPYFRFRHLSSLPGIRHAVFTRHGGNSTGPYQALNVSFSVGDDPEAVRKNRGRIDRLMETTPAYARQRHGTCVVVIGPEPAGRAGHPPEADAMITDVPGRHLVIQVADCQGVILYDPVRRVLANVHSGWRGSVQNILGATVDAMAEGFGCRPADLVAGIGPSLGPCCAEFVNYRQEIPETLWGYRVGLCHFDFWTLSVDQLRQAGVPALNIETSGLCTRCRTDLFFSYRGERTTGRFAVAAGLL